LIILGPIPGRVEAVVGRSGGRLPVGARGARHSGTVTALVLLVVALELLGVITIGGTGNSPVSMSNPTVRDSPVTPAISRVSGGVGNTLRLGTPLSTSAAWDCSQATVTSTHVGCATSASKSKRPDPAWTELNYGPPSPRDFYGMVNDVSAGDALLFGGESPTGTPLNDTWEYSYSTGLWTKLTPKTSPTARWGAAMAYDAKDGCVVLYGGFNGTAVLSDTWEFASGQWSKLTTKGHPAPVAFASFADDPAAGHVVLFGGVNLTGALSSATWEYVSGKWTKLTLAKSPQAREMSSMAYDAPAQQVVLYGGRNSTGKSLNDTWTFSSGAWTNVSTVYDPPGRSLAAIAYAPETGAVVLFGGFTGSQVLSSTWIFAQGNWTKVSSEFHPSDREGMAMADGTNTSGPLLFGGESYTGTLLNDLWTINGTTWTHLLLPLPAPRINAAMTYDQADGYVLLYGGYANGNDLSDTWKYSNGVWTELHPTVSPGARDHAAMTYDATDGYVLLFGGHSPNGSYLDDTWEFAAGQWTPIHVPAGNAIPDGRGYASMTYDAADGYVLLFGGWNGTLSGNVLGDTWTYSAGTWAKLSPTPSPSPRYGSEMTFDSETGFVVLFSGFFNSGHGPNGELGGPDDTWSFSGGTWTNLTSSLPSSPPLKGFAGLVDDTYEGYPALYGGLTNYSTDSGTNVWAFVGTSWSGSPSSPNPGGEFSFGMAYYPNGNEIVLFSDAGGTWIYD
jgi:hypothetical protein